MDLSATQNGSLPPPPSGSSSAISAGASPITPAQSGLRAKVKPRKHPIMQFLESVSSLKVTVALFALALILVFYATIAQVDSSLHTVVKRYFRSPFVLIPMDVVLFNINHIYKDANGIVNYHFPGWIPFPAGQLLGGAMLLNLIVAHIIHFKARIRKLGIWFIHLGVIILLCGEITYQFFSIEGSMAIEIGRTSNVVQHPTLGTELAFERVLSADEDEVITISGNQLKEGALIEDEKLPVIVKVVQYMRNSDLKDVEPGKESKNLATAGLGKQLIAVDEPEISGVANNQSENMASAYITLLDRKTRKELSTRLVSLFLPNPEWVELEGKKYQMSLRFKRTYRPYSLYLEQFDFKKFPGTEIPKDYRSHVRLRNPQSNEDRKIEIYMNAPLRYEGETYYQASLLPGNRGTVLQVVRNPYVSLPYISCFVVGLGLLIHFGMTLTQFLTKVGRVS